MSDDGMWFASRQLGSGPGVPISWKGWALAIAFTAIVVGVILAFKDHPLQLAAALIPPVTVFLVVSCRTTRGGCRWRWRKEE